ncbi:MAG: hypothetical protein IIC51_09705 [Planctomycetes bacterium]|nr:hypothetical protein [Planctomycetota bacterium]
MKATQLVDKLIPVLFEDKSFLAVSKPAGLDGRSLQDSEYNYRRARWKRRKLEGKMPIPTLKNYKPCKCWQRGDS